MTTRRAEPGAADFQIVVRQWRDLTGHDLQPRRANLLEARQERADVSFFMLADRAFGDDAFLDRLSRVAQQWLQRCPCETTRAIAAYAAYLRGDFPRAVTLLMACVTDSPQNLDNWVDLAFSLNHVADPLGRHILFNHDEYVRRFPTGAVCTPSRLQEIRAAIEAEGAGYDQVWPRWFEGVAPRV